VTVLLVRQWISLSRCHMFVAKKADQGLADMCMVHGTLKPSWNNSMTVVLIHTIKYV